MPRGSRARFGSFGRAVGGAGLGRTSGRPRRVEACQSRGTQWLSTSWPSRAAVRACGEARHARGTAPDAARRPRRPRTTARSRARRRAPFTIVSDWAPRTRSGGRRWRTRVTGADGAIGSRAGSRAAKGGQNGWHGVCERGRRCPVQVRKAVPCRFLGFLSSLVVSVLVVVGASAVARARDPARLLFAPPPASETAAPAPMVTVHLSGPGSFCLAFLFVCSQAKEIY